MSRLAVDVHSLSALLATTHAILNDRAEPRRHFLGMEWSLERGFERTGSRLSSRGKARKRTHFGCHKLSVASDQAKRQHTEKAQDLVWKPGRVGTSARSRVALHPKAGQTILFLRKDVSAE